MLSLINHRYLIIQELGSGGMGTVYLVKDTLRNNQILALKTFYIDTLGEKSHAQFKSEFEVLAQLHHPNLVEVYDFGTISETQQYFFTMEYIPGETWQELASRQRTGASTDFYWLYPITLQVCRALQYIHSRGIIHYDIKPANIRVTPEGRVKLMDFGLNKRVDMPDTTTSLPRGTPAYVAPEVIRQELPDHRADLYALGVTLYEVTTGLLPYAGKMGALGSQEKTVIFPEIPGRSIPPELKETILKLMSKAPADRYQSAGEIIQSMTRYIKVEHITPAIASYQDYVQNSSFVGRETELTYLQKHLAQMIQGKGHLLLITGEAGIGKTRLMREIRLRAQVQRVLVCEALCPEHVQSPYQPWITVFKQVMAQYRTTNPQILRQFAGAIIGLMPELIGALRAVPITGKIPQDKQLLINSATEFLLATNTPLLIILDNLHYADAETLTLLTNISTQIHKGRMLIVGLYRDAEIGKTHTLHNLESRAPTHPACKLLQLGPLDNDAIRAVAASMLGIPLDKSAQGLPEGLLPRLVAQTGGNPLFIESLIYSLVEQRCLYYDGHLWRLDRQKLPDTPLTIKQAAQQRLLKLNPTTLQFLQWAAVIGQQPNIDILQEVSQIPAQQLAEQISQATRHHVLVQAGESNQPRYRFSNDQMHQVIYDTLTPQERAKRHQCIGSALRNNYTENEILEQLAWHFEHAGELKDALQYAKKAGDKARRIYANESASQYYSKALELLHANQDNVTPETHYDILSGRAEAYRLMGNRQAQHADLETMIRISAQMGDIARQIEAVNRLVELDNYLGNHTEARRKAEAGLELARQVHDEKLEAASLDALGEALFGLGEFETAYDVHEQALAICLILNDRKGEAHNLWHLGRIARVLGRLAQAQEHLKASLELHHALGDQPGENDALNELGNQTQDHQLRRDYYERSLEIAQRMGDKYRIGRAYNNLAITYLALGLYDRGRNYVEPAVEIQRETQDLSNLAYSLETLGRVYLELGTYEKANEVFQEGLVLSQDMGDRGVESIYWFNLGCVKLALGNTQEAEEYLLKAHTMQEEMGLLCYLYTTLAWLGMLYLEIGNWETADRYTARAVESLQVAGPGEYSPQEAWWLRYQVLKAMPPELQDNRSNDAMWTTLQNAHVTMMNGITTLRDEGLRRNYLNKVKVNRDIITEWARQLSKREQGTVLSKATAAVRQEADGDTEARVLKDRLKRVLNISVRMNETRDAASL
ncbi:MAG: DUF2791 family P-loop domain-containing protein, partial [Anaerolineae bacterium]|nr:DUF2791 family P-loop domain-containing protein [Anaerolineae bacterium]